MKNCKAAQGDAFCGVCQKPDKIFMGPEHISFKHRLQMMRDKQTSKDDPVQMMQPQTALVVVWKDVLCMYSTGQIRSKEQIHTTTSREVYEAVQDLVMVDWEHAIEEDTASLRQLALSLMQPIVPQMSPEWALPVSQAIHTLGGPTQLPILPPPTLSEQPEPQAAGELLQAPSELAAELVDATRGAGEGTQESFGETQRAMDLDVPAAGGSVM
ncbi:hypothetical protein FRC06_004108 [Ceratobasidium sp. 370]|nr:hypothetical protein FRC06_004108 [Ceratobasidium sp. 370]